MTSICWFLIHKLIIIIFHLNGLFFNMCEQRVPNSLLKQMYTAHTETIKRYLTQSVLPAIQAVAQGSSDPTKQLEEMKFRWLWIKLDYRYTSHYIGVPSLTEKVLWIYSKLIFMNTSRLVQRIQFLDWLKKREMERLSTGWWLKAY